MDNSNSEKERINRICIFCFLTEKLARVMTSYFRPDLKFETATEKEAEVSSFVLV